MKLISILLQLLLILEIVIFINGLFFSKSKKQEQRHLIAAKYDPEMPKKVRKILEEVGDNRILKIQLGRTPVEKVLILFLNLISRGKFNKKQIELGYDEIYHNYLLITIQNEKESTSEDVENDVDSKVYKLEKAQRIGLMKPKYPTEFVDTYDIPLTPNKTFTLNRLITTASNIDKKFYYYDAGDNNMCQTFVENIVDINGLTPNIDDQETRMALKPQDAKALIATLGKRKDIIKSVTDLAGNFETLLSDHKIKWKKPVDKEFVLLDNMNIELTNENNDELLRNTNDVVSDFIIQNTDEIFNAVVALEEVDREKKRKKKIIMIIGIILAIVLVQSAAAAIAFYFWRKRKTKNDSEKTEVSGVTNNE